MKPKPGCEAYQEVLLQHGTKWPKPAKTIKMKQEINNFMQTDTESVYQAWERLAAILRKYPHHGIQDPGILYIFLSRS